MQNVEFTTGPGGTGNQLQAWCESSCTSSSTSTWWVNLGSNILAAYPSTGNTITIYMNFMPGSVMSPTGPTGEAPQISGTYAQYDNGASVFGYYNNFISSGSVSGFTSGGGFTATASNGLTLNSIGGTSNTGYVYTSTSYYNTNFVYEAYGEAQQQVTAGSIDFGTSVQTNANYMQNYEFGLWLWGSGSYNWETYCLGNCNSGTSPAPNLNQFYVLTTAVTPSTCNYLVNYNNVGTLSYGSSSVNPSYIGFHMDKGNVQLYYWMRIRAYSPNNVMPSASLGAVA